jgi:hypothetical protein
VPTPFYHLSVAIDLLEHPALTEYARQLLVHERGAFLFGNTAPDVQTISRQSRADTHFFDLPLSSNPVPPWLFVREKYEVLGDTSRLGNAQAGFLAGYLCHLQADWIWIRDIFVPVFGKKCTWSTFHQRLYLHNVLRSYLDREILPALIEGNGVGKELKSAAISNWLPFVEDRHLIDWRDFVADQLLPGAMIRTVEVFAERQGISPREYYSLLSSEERMESEVFAYLSRQDLAKYRRSVLESNVQLINAYLTVTHSGRRMAASAQARPASHSVHGSSAS